jgi:hypothetical protein
MPAVNVWIPAAQLDAMRAHNLSPSVVVQVAGRDALAVLNGTRAASNQTVRDIIEENETRTRNDPPG